ALFVVRAAVTLTAALLSYRLVEQPIRKGRLRRLHRRLPLVLTPVAVAAVIGILFVPTVAASREVDEGGKPSATAVQVTAQYAAVTRCGPALYLPHPSAKAPLVELVGNSMADEEVPCLSA